MEVKPGYKRTEVGVIPEEWEVKKLGQIGSFSKGKGIRKAEAQSGDIPCIRYGELYTLHNDYVKCFGSFISNEVAQTSRRLKAGDILFAGSGETKEEIGKSAAFVHDIGAYAGGDIVILSPRLGDSLFYGYLFNLPQVAKQKAKRGQGDAVVHIYASALSNIVVPMPPLPEQQAIATALSDVDGLIDSLTKLIDKKKNIKQGAMQGLLTGRKRLEGFGGAWRRITVGEIGRTYGGLTGKSKCDFEKGESKYIPFLNVMNNPVIDTRFLEVVSIAEDETQNSAKVGDLFFNTSSETPGEVGMCSVLLQGVGNLYLNSFCFGFRINDLSLFNPLFLVYLFRGEVGRELMFSLAQGATRYNLSTTYFNKLEITIPDIKEQIAIANILSDMDAEIEALERKRAKYEALKQGMMQELLTGRIRLI